MVNAFDEILIEWTPDFADPESFGPAKRDSKSAAVNAESRVIQ